MSKSDELGPISSHVCARVCVCVCVGAITAVTSLLTVISLPSPLSLQQQVVELSGYVIILVENAEGKIKLYGSPSDRDNLEVGDEILEVNGLTLDNISRTEAIRHIHDVSITKRIHINNK